MVTNDRLSCIALRLPELDTVAAREFVDDEETDVVSSVRILRTRIAEADDEPESGYDASGTSASAGAGASMTGTAVCARSASACSATREASIVTIVVSGGVTR